MSTHTEIEVKGRTVGPGSDHIMRTIGGAAGEEFDTVTLVDKENVVVGEIDSKYTPELASILDYLFKSYPESTITVDVSWDNRDADDPGATKEVYRNGKLVSQMGMQMVELDVENTEDRKLLRKITEFANDLDMPAAAFRGKVIGQLAAYHFIPALDAG